MHDLLNLLLPLALCLGHEVSPLDWAQRFWAAETVEQRDDVAAEWLATSSAFEVVKHALERGRHYAADAPTGYLLRKRVGSEGAVYPYLILVPSDYTPERKWPVRLNLRGGMGAPPWDPEEAAWPGEWTHAGSEIIVLPAGWADSMWWHASQVENIEAILREVRATWNIDEEQVAAVGNSDGGAALFFIAMRYPDMFSAYAGHVAPPPIV